MTWMRAGWMMGLVACGPSPEVVSYELSYGECQGPCGFRITRDADTVSLEVEDADREVEPIVRTTVLTDAGIEAWDDGASTMGGLKAVYGCPGCLDGGVVEVVISHPDDGETSTHQWERDAPPAEAEAFDAVGMELIEALRGCGTSDLVEDLADCMPI
jgi:hypothetical protein